MPKRPQHASPESDFDFAPAWRPDQNENHRVLEGEFVEIAEGFSDYGPYPIVTIVTDDGEEFAWHALTEIAKHQLVQARPVIGHRLRISYGGRKEGKNSGHEPYHRWAVRNLSLSPEQKTASILDRYAGTRPTPAPDSPSSGQFDDEPPF